jgi:hypothetical protein
MVVVKVGDRFPMLRELYCSMFSICPLGSSRRIKLLTHRFEAYRVVLVVVTVPIY